MKLPFTTDDGCGHRARIGLIVLQADETLEYELSRLFDLDGVALHVSRVPSGLDVTPETLAEMANHIPQSAALLPSEAGFAAIAYACTSGATVIGEARVKALIESALGKVAVTNPLSAVKAVCQEHKFTRLGFVTPYRADVSKAMRLALEKSGIEIAGFGSFEEISDRVVARIDLKSILAAIETVAAQAPCDAVFVSCTNLRSLELIDEAEARIERPVFTSNTALAWHLARLAGLDRLSSTAPGTLLGLAKV